MTLSLGNAYSEVRIKKKRHLKAKIRLDPNNDFVEQVNHHTHPSSQAKYESTKVEAGIKQRLMETVMTSQQVLAEQLARTSEGAAINLALLEKTSKISVQHVKKRTYNLFL